VQAIRAKLDSMRFQSLSVPSVLALILALNGGCDRRTEPFVPADQEPPAPQRAVRIPGLEKPKPRPQGLKTRSSPRQRAVSGAPVTGTVLLSHGVAVGPEAVLFVIARTPDGGPPLAAKRLSAGRFPVEFTLGAADLMGADRSFAGPLQISARVDGDGDPLTRGPGDLTGELAGLVDDGQQGLEIVLRPVDREAGS